MSGNIGSNLALRGDGAPALSTLAAEVCAACERRAADRGPLIEAALRRAAAEPMLLTAPQMQAADGCYKRHCLHADPHGRFSIISIVWKAGQFSPVHGHRTWCGYVVYRGTLVEIDYGLDQASREPLHRKATLRPAGDSCFASEGLNDIHRLGNPGGEPAISIHVYGVRETELAGGVNWVIGP